VLRGLRALLADDGHLCIADLEEDDGAFHGHSPHFEGHDGFAAAHLDGLLRGAGFAPTARERVHLLRKEEGAFPVCLATAVPRG
jgi:hypothetical protein